MPCVRFAPSSPLGAMARAPSGHYIGNQPDCQKARLLGVAVSWSANAGAGAGGQIQDLLERGGYRWAIMQMATKTRRITFVQQASLTKIDAVETTSCVTWLRVKVTNCMSLAALVARLASVSI